MREADVVSAGSWDSDEERIDLHQGECAGSEEADAGEHELSVVELAAAELRAEGSPRHQKRPSEDGCIFAGFESGGGNKQRKRRGQVGEGGEMPRRSSSFSDRLAKILGPEALDCPGDGPQVHGRPCTQSDHPALDGF